MDAVSASSHGREATNGNTQAPSKSLRIRLGVEDFSLRPIALELNADTPHVLVGGGPGSGRTGVLHTCLLMLAATSGNRDARVILVDFRRTSRMLRRLPNIWMYADTEDRLIEVVNVLKTELRERMTKIREELEKQQDDNDEPIGTNMTPIVLLIDDYDQLSILMKNPLNDLKEFMLQARDLHLHIIVAGASGDLTRSDALLQQVRACRMGVVLGGDPADQPLLGVRMSDMPAGRGYIVRRNQKYFAQVANLPPGTMLLWTERLIQATQVRETQLLQSKANTIVNDVVGKQVQDAHKGRPASLPPAYMN